METLQPGDECEECLNHGLNHKLRYFYINLEEQLLKCESRQCLWPHNDEVSSSEEEGEGEDQATTNVDDYDDAFIVQMLQQLAAEEPATESPFDTETCSMPELTDLTTAGFDPVVDATTAATVQDACHMEEKPRDLACISPKSIPLQRSPPKTLSNHDKRLSATTTTTIATTTAAAIKATTSVAVINSMPDLLTEFSGNSNLQNESSALSTLPNWKDAIKDEPSILIGTCSSADSKEFSVSVSFPGQELKTHKETPKTPKIHRFLTPKKASTTLMSKQQSNRQSNQIHLESQTATQPPPSSLLSTFRDAVKREQETRSLLGQKQLRGKRKVSGITAKLVGCGGQSRTELVKQLKQSVENTQKKEDATECEQEVEEETSK